MPEHLQVVVVWDGAWRSDLPESLHPLPKGLVTLPRNSLAGYRGPGPAQEDALVDDLVRWASTSPTLVIPWRGLPEPTLQLVAMTSRILDRDWMVMLPPVATPLTAVSIGWQVARLAEVEPIDVREALAVGRVLADETESALLLGRPHRSPAIELGLLDFLRSLRPGTKLVRWAGLRMASTTVAGATPMLVSGHAADTAGPRLVLALRADEVAVPDLGVSPGDAVVEMHPGGLDADAWGQRRFVEIAACPLDLSSLLPPAARLCRGCERLVSEIDGPCGECTLPYE